MSVPANGIRSAYIHIPFCRHRCGYCNFTVIAERNDLISDYFRAIEIELQQLGDPNSVDTLFFGGGTPTHLTPDQLTQLFETVARCLPTNYGAEISVEANPEDIDVERAEVLMAHGVNRVSLGVQSFRDEKLRTLERSHHGERVVECVEILRPRIQSLSLDLIFGSPEETLEQWQSDLRNALDLAPDHLSTYGLTYEPGTNFYTRREKNELQSLPEESECQMYESAIDTLRSHEFEHYEVSNFAKTGHRCRHNENYWECGQFFGIGPGASSYVDGVRRSNHRSTTTYLKKVLNGDSAIDEEDALSEREKAHEALVFGLRKLEGVEIESFEGKTKFALHELAGENLDWLMEEALLENANGRLRLTHKGLLVSDSIWPYLL